MKNIKKKGLALLMIAMMLISMLGTAFTAGAEGELVYLTMEAGAFVEITPEIPAVSLYFTPETTGIYSFVSEGCNDAFARLYNAEDEEIAYDDDGGGEMNFCVTGSLTAGETYRLECESFEQYDSFTVSVKESEVVGLEAHPIELYEHVDGYWDTEYDYFYYSNIAPSFTLEFKDGTKVSSVNGRVEHEGVSYYCNFSNMQNAENPWLLGNSYELTVHVAGLSASTTVTIVESPVASVEFKDLEFYEKTNGSLSSDYDAETDSYGPSYYKYNYIPQFTVTLKDGTVLEGKYGFVELEGKNYHISYDDGQCYENAWTAGNDYTVEASVLGVDTSYTVTILECPVASIQFEAKTVLENLDGYWDSDEGGDYFRYDDEPPKFTVTLKDGTVLKSEYVNVYYDGIFYYPDISTGQGTANPWTVGNKYEVEMSILGFDTSYEVEVVPSPAVSATGKKTTLVEGMHGDDYGGFFYYYVNPEFTVTLKDGTVLESEYGSVKYNGNYYYFEGYSDQSIEDPWLPGNTYEIHGEVMGVATTALVEIVENPFETLTVENSSLIENTGGDWLYYIDEETGKEEKFYVYYNIEPEFTVTLKDGTVLSSEDGCVEYLGVEYYLYADSVQTSEDPWTVGNTYDAIAIFGDLTKPFKVTIGPSPFTDLPKGAYYTDAVNWAIDRGITTGTTPTTFSPTKFCSRAQIVTFLWRNAGCPEPETTTMPFTDVPEGAYYYDAVLWAVENGITTGKTATTFAPGETCNRAQIVTFLWRANNERMVKASNTFTDVKADAYYADAVYWAAKEGITTGTTATTFSPSNSCSRAQIVTFLYRAW